MLMPDTCKQDETATLAHWNYSREEWKAFMRWKKMKKGIVYYILHRLLPVTKKKTPSITITSARVCEGDVHEPFHDTERRLKHINIRDAGKMNVMEISYERQGLQNYGNSEIHVLVPKGKLKEAIDVEEKLNMIRDTSQPGWPQ
jgi:hypothetical protein